MKSIFRNILILILLVLSASDIFAQSVVTIERFSSARELTVDGQQVRKIYDARFKMGNVTMVCDSAWQFLGKGEMRAYGNIQIDTDTENIWTDTLYYFNNQDLSWLRGRVVIHQDSTTLFGTKVDYNFLTKVAYFREGIRLEDADGTLTALSGTYFQNQDSAIFRNQVQLQDSAQYAEGDSLFINRKREYLELYSNIFVYDSTNNGLLTGDYLEADSTGRRFVLGNAYTRKIDSDSSSASADTTHIFAHEILLFDRDSTSSIFAYDTVSVWASKFSSLSDSLNYESDTQLFQLKGRPKAWHKNIQLTGPYIAVQMDSSEVKELRSYIGAFAVQEDSTTHRLNQLKGDTLVAYFEDGDISEILLHPNSEILYHTKNEADEPDGAMENASPITILTFENGELMRAKMGQNTGLFLPEYTDLINRRLEGFQWNPELRPQKPTLTPEPKWDPVPEERPFELPSRYVKFLESLDE